MNTPTLPSVIFTCAVLTNGMAVAASQPGSQIRELSGNESSPGTALLTSRGWFQIELVAHKFVVESSLHKAAVLATAGFSVDRPYLAGMIVRGPMTFLVNSWSDSDS